MKKRRERAAGYVRDNHLLGRLVLLVGNMEEGRRDQKMKGVQIGRQ